MQYRREIDGLRAIAVLPVILFHAGFTIFSGGFVGVDVFFVISGYLITSILIAELERDEFSIVRFYERRARRILPALFFVMLACLPFAYWWMLPDQLVDFGQSLVAVMFFASNILFWRETGYFESAAELKPLLHTWSLAVEEQYYLLFPLFLAFMWRFGRSRAVWGVVGIAVVSLLLSEWGWRNKPVANFFLSPTRAWELFAGSLCAFVPLRAPRRYANGLSALGLVLIVGAIFVYDGLTPFPSLYSLAPVMGTVLIILFARQGTWVAWLLSLRGFVGVGLISYSAYLWHQPLFAFARLRSLFEPSHTLMGSLAAASLILAWVSWRWVEQPFRKKPRSMLADRRSLFGASALGGAVFVVIGVIAQLGQGFDGRFDQKVLGNMYLRLGDTSGCHNALGVAEIQSGADCRVGALNGMPRLAVIGDSHASRITDALSEQLTTRDLAAVAFNGSWCAPLRNFATDAPEKNTCLPKVSAQLDQILERPELKQVVLFAQWAHYIKGRRWPETTAAAYTFSENGPLDFAQARVADNAEAFEAALNRTLAELHRAGKQITIILPTPEYEFYVNDALVRALHFGVDVDTLRLPVAAYDDRNAQARDILLRVGAQYQAGFVDPKGLFCDDETCAVAGKNRESLYEDSNHLSFHGSERVVARLLEQLTTSNQE